MGEDIVGMFDFSVGTVPCVQVGTLQNVIDSELWLLSWRWLNVFERHHRNTNIFIKTVINGQQDKILFNINSLLDNEYKHSCVFVV